MYHFCLSCVVPAFFCFVLLFLKRPYFKKLYVTHDLWGCLWEFLMNEVRLHLFRDCLHVLKRTLSVLEHFELTVCSYLEITHVVQIWAFMFLIAQLLLSNSDENLLFSIITQHQIKSRSIFVDGISSYSSACSGWALRGTFQLDASP